VILVDSSVWIDYFRGRTSQQTDRLDRLLGAEALLVGDLILAEVLQGFGNQRDFNQARRLLESFQIVALSSPSLAVQAARNFRELRAHGITVRKTIDTVIATWCIENDHALLHSDRDFDAFETHLGLEVVRD
jgi:predicted nucleic acid-binding protein